MDYTNKRFKIIMPLLKGDFENDGFYYIKYGLSTNTVDLENEKMSDECLKDMLEQTQLINGFEAHEYGLDETLGPVVDSWTEKQGSLTMMYVKVRVKPSATEKIKEHVETGTRIGGSLGGLYVKDHMENGIKVVDKVKLLDATLTPLPVNWDTIGTLEAVAKSCKTGLCKQITKSIQDRYFEKAKKSDYIVNEMCMEHAKELIENGDVNNGPWSKPVFADFDNDIEEYKKFALAKHPDMDETLARTYGFEIGKNGKIYRQGVISAKQAAAGGRSKAGKNTELYNAADELLTLIDKEEEDEDVTKAFKTKAQTLTESDSYESIRDNVTAALREEYGIGPNSNDWLWVNQTFPDSAIFELYGDGESAYYEIPYSIDDEGTVTLGEAVEVELTYVEKKLEVFKIKTKKGDDSMDEKTVQKMIEDNNKVILDGVKELVKPGEEPPKEPENVAKELDRDILVTDVTAGVLKALGIEPEKEEEPESNGIIVMDQKALEDLQEDAVKKALLAIGKQREGQRKSKSVGGSKFADPTEPVKEEKTKGVKRVSTKEAAELTVKGIIPAA